MRLPSAARTGSPTAPDPSAAAASQAGILRRPVKAAFVTAFMVAAIFVGMAGRASASEYSYCYHCVVYNNSDWPGPSPVPYEYYTLSYHHYLWDAYTGYQGSAWIGAGEANVGGVAHAWNEAAHSYSGQYRSFVFAENTTAQGNYGRDIISNAHGDY